MSLTDKVICKQCKKEFKSWYDIGFLILMRDPEACKDCDGYDSYDWDVADKIMCWPCLRCIRTVIWCKECGRKQIIHQIEEYRHDGFVYSK